MLGWFKKKFSRNKKKEEPLVEPGPRQEAAAEPTADAGTVEELTAGQAPAEPATEGLVREPEAGAVVAPPPRQEIGESPAAAEEVPAPAAAGEEGREPEADEDRGPEPEAEAGETAGPEPAEPRDEAGPARTVDVGRDKPRSMFRRLQERLGKTRDTLVHRLDNLFLGKKEIDDQLLDDLEEILITADLGVGTAMELLDSARRSVRRKELSDPQALKKVLRDKILAFLQESDQPAELVMPDEGPFVIMVVGVNGVGKTTSIGKIAAKFVRSGQSVLLVAGDTFRAAAIDQLKIWGQRTGVEVVAGTQGADPSSVVFDGVARGVAGDYDVVLIDTAGRLHTSVNLMEELKKIKRVIGKKLAGAPHEVMLVLDATTGQNGISQAKLFHEAVGITGLTLTKLDGTAKGGIVVNVCRELKIPVRFIGIGEHVDDLRDFSPEEFVDALFARDNGKQES
ncbi:MAG TPA: signal recognition particle-docking protein FtsY [Desulfobulbus sp.]|nr:signal recognition particle-docking protein FtsY [Desulfobulbus sp.]